MHSWISGMAVLDDWLHSEARTADSFQHFEVIDITERDAPDASVKEHLCDLLRESAVDLAFLEDVTRRLGWGKAEAMVARRLPEDSRARRGRFGEVVGVFMFHQMDGYVIPIDKAHFAITGGQSQPSTDAVLLRIEDNAVAEVCFVESKLRTRSDNSAGVEGARQLKADYEKEIPDMLAFTAARLFERDDSIYSGLMDYMATRDGDVDMDSFRLLLFYDGDIWSERCLTNLEDDEPETSPLRVHATRISALRELVDDIFDRVGMAVVDDEP